MNMKTMTLGAILSVVITVPTCFAQGVNVGGSGGYDGKAAGNPATQKGGEIMNGGGIGGSGFDGKAAGNPATQKGGEIMNGGGTVGGNGYDGKAQVHTTPGQKRDEIVNSGGRPGDSGDGFDGMAKGGDGNVKAQSK